VRPSIKELYGVNPQELRNMPAEVYHSTKIELLKIRKRKLSTELRLLPLDAHWEQAQAIDALIKYIDKAIDANEKDLAELTGGSV